MKWEEMRYPKKGCEGCCYAGRTGSGPSCDYILMEGRRRPCPAGILCTVKKERKKVVGVHTQYLSRLSKWQ